MLDTVILTFPKSSYRILYPHMFTPNAAILDGPGNYLVKCVNNPTASDKKKGIYRPRLTLMKRMTRNGPETTLRVEFSATKMIYGNNVDEVEKNDFKDVARALKMAMWHMGVFVADEEVARASVSAFHPSKNIELRDGYTSSFVITELNKIDVSKRMDLNKDSFRNSGQSLQFYTNSHSLVIYDKVQDLKKPEKRAMDKDQNAIQRSLFDALNEKQRKEILRIEARLAKKVKLNATLRKLGYRENPTFEDIFKSELCQKVLQSYWEDIIKDKNLFLFDVEMGPQKMIKRIFKNKPSIKPKNAIYLVGLSVLSREGVRDTRAIIERYATARTWYRIAEDLSFLTEISDKNYHGWATQVQRSLDEFSPFRLSTSSGLICKEK